MRLRAQKRFPFLVAVPIPRFDSGKREINKERIDEAIREVLDAFSRWFGGAKVLHSAGAYRMLDGSVVLDGEEPAVVSMKTGAEYRRRKPEIEGLLDSLGTKLDQESMAVIACPAEGFLVFRG